MSIAAITAWLCVVALGPAQPPSDTVVAERCDGSRTVVSKSTGCTAWRVEWIKDGVVWGVTSAADKEALVSRRDAMLGFARSDARLFNRPFDPRFAEPSPLICDVCKAKPNLGRWGSGQTFSGLGASTAVTTARTRYESLQTEVMSKHIPALADAARLSKFKSTKKAAARYAKAIQTAAVSLAEHARDLEDADRLLVEDDVTALAKRIDATKTELEQSRAALETVVFKTVAKAHGGTYSQDGASSPAQLVVAFDGAKVTGTYSVGGSTSTWFEGEVGLDGSVTGRSLMAPETGKLKCQDHSEKCGYEYINSVLRFADGADPKTERAELWFQRSKWVQAPVFTRKK